MADDGDTEWKQRGVQRLKQERTHGREGASWKYKERVSARVLRAAFTGSRSESTHDGEVILFSERVIIQQETN